MAMADKRNFFEDPVGPKPRLARVVILTGAASERIVWKALATEAGWYTRHECGRIVHQWQAPTRVFHVQCSGCGKWVAAP